MSHRKLPCLAVALAVGFATGIGILVLKKCVTGDSDPFQAGWPLFLQLAACLATFVVTWKWCPGIMSAVGLYAGLAGYMLALRTSEYPVSSLIALAIHGFVPALVGSLVAFAVRCRSNRLPKNRSHA